MKTARDIILERVFEDDMCLNTLNVVYKSLYECMTYRGSVYYTHKFDTTEVGKLIHNILSTYFGFVGKGFLGEENLSHVFAGEHFYEVQFDLTKADYPQAELPIKYLSKLVALPEPDYTQVGKGVLMDYKKINKDVNN